MLIQSIFGRDADESRDPHKVKKGYTADSIWRNRDTFLRGTDEIVEFLTKKWSVENGYRLRKELFAFTENKVSHVFMPSSLKAPPMVLRIFESTLLIVPKIAVQFWYEWHDTAGQWYRTYGLEDWTFAADGRMRKRQMSGNDVKIADAERWFKDGVDVNTVDISEKHW
jgi:nuclear transport factor 2 (NTF2) superfamily protein